MPRRNRGENGKQANNRENGKDKASESHLGRDIETAISGHGEAVRVTLGRIMAPGERAGAIGEIAVGSSKAMLLWVVVSVNA